MGNIDSHVDVTSRPRGTQAKAQDRLELLDGRPVAARNPASAADNNRGKARQWGPERQIRAQVIRWLCVDRLARDQVDPSAGIAVHAAKVVGNLTLSFVTVPFALQLWRSALTDDTNLIQ